MKICNNIVVIILLIGVIGCDTSPSPAPYETKKEKLSRVEGRSYSVPLPSGFSLPDIKGNPRIEQLKSIGGLILAEKERPDFENAFLASIVVLPIQNALVINSHDESQCRKVANLINLSSEGPEVKTVGIVQFSNGKHCHFTIQDRVNPVRAGSGTVFSTSKEAWVVTCNYDRRDSQAIAACYDVLNGWKFK